VDHRYPYNFKPYDGTRVQSIRARATVAGRGSPLKLAYVDVETTGLNPQLHTIWNAAVIIQAPGMDTEEFSFKCRPLPGAAVDGKALKVGGIKEEDLLNFSDPTACKKDLEKFLSIYVDRYDKRDKYNFIAYNSPFDMEFLRNWFVQQGDDYFGSWFWFPDICVMRALASKLMGRRRDIKNFQMSTVAKFLGIEIDSNLYHNALYDARIVKRLYAEFS
jgi:DNA polymerase-3 subunit epsilon